MEWYHKVDPIWMQERLKYVTASQIKNFVPLTPTGRPRDVSKAWISWLGDYKRTSKIADDECVSRGTAARGHVLEPWAVAVFNKFFRNDRMKGRPVHVDDVLITKNMIGWSPDGIFDLEDKSYAKMLDRPHVSIKDLGQAFCPFHAVEVKCYTEANHYASAFCDKMKLEERWQIATAFYVVSSLKSVFLVFYNPETEDEMFVNEYHRDELECELEIIAGIDSTAQLVSGLRKPSEDEEVPEYAEKHREPFYAKEFALVNFDYICDDYAKRMMIL